MPRRWIVLSVEGLASLSLGPYGSSWNATPAVDRLAASGVTWDRVVVPDEDVVETLRRFWGQTVGDRSWVENCRAEGPIELLLTRDGVAPADTPRLANVALELGIDTCSLIDLAPCTEVPQDVESTGWGQTFAALLDRIGPASDDSLGPANWSVLWLHSDLLTKCWDAPRWLFPVDEEVPETEPRDPADACFEDSEIDGSAADWAEAELPPALIDGIVPPSLRLGSSDHPDWVTAWMQTYGCQVLLLDLWIGMLLDFLRRDSREIGVALIGTSGFSLGQGGWFGHHVGPIRSPQIQVPVILYRDKWQPLRWPELVALDSVAAWLVPKSGDDATEQGLPTPEAWARALVPGSVVTASPRAERVISTSEWFYTRQGDQSCSLFLKPDDRDDVNDIADRCPGVLADLERLASGSSQIPSADNSHLG